MLSMHLVSESYALTSSPWSIWYLNKTQHNTFS